MNKILFMFVALLAIYSHSKIGIFNSNLAKGYGNFTSAKEIAKTIQGSIRTYLENQLEEEPRKQVHWFSYINITKLIMPDAPNKKVEVELIELLKKVAYQKSKKGTLNIVNKLIKAIVEEDYRTIIFFSMVALRYLLFIKLVR